MTPRPDVDAALQAWAAAHARSAGRSGASLDRNTEAAETGLADLRVTVTESGSVRLPAGTEVVAVAWLNRRGGQLLTAGSFSGKSPSISNPIHIRAWDPDTHQSEEILSPFAGGFVTMTCSQGSEPTLAVTVAQGGTLVTEVHDLGADSVLSVRRVRRALPRDYTGRADEVCAALSAGRSRFLVLVRVARQSSDSKTTATSFLDIFDLRNRQTVVYSHQLDWEVKAIGWSSGPEQPLLAVGGAANCADGGKLLIWDPWEWMSREYQTSNRIRSIAWSAGSVTRTPKLAVAAGSRIDILDPDSGEFVQTCEHSATVLSMVWWDRQEGTLLVSLTDSPVLRLWDPATGELVDDYYNIQYGGRFARIAWLPEANRIRLAIDRHVCEVTAVVSDTAAPHQEVSESLPVPPRPASLGFLALGAGGLWAPLGLVSDALTLVGGTRRRLYDPRLDPLKKHPGIARIRALGWPADARVGLAALLVDGQGSAEHIAPADTAPSDRLRSLFAALATGPGSPVSAPSAAQAVTEAADAVTDKTVMILRILGPDAVVADPLLPLRLTGRVPALPELTPRQTALFDGGYASRRQSSRNRAAAPQLMPGVSGISRRGPLHTALPTQLALPDDLRMLRYARGELLHRTHPARRPLPTEPVTIVLDTTPATYGKCETVLRLTAHMVTITLWHAGRTCTLITLTHPGQARDLSRPEDLLALWTSRTLMPPDFRRALKTAADAVSDTVIILTNSHAARDQFAAIRLGPRHHLLTAHTPTSAPPPPPVHPNHRQVLTSIGSDQIIAHVTAMLARDAEAAG
jgi:hypothetical protein